MVQRVNYDTLPEAVGPYVHATKHNETLYLSGLTALGTKAQTGGFQEQCAEVLAQIEGVLKQEKRSKGDIVKVTIFLKDISQRYCSIVGGQRATVCLLRRTFARLFAGGNLQPDPFGFAAGNGSDHRFASLARSFRSLACPR